MLQLSPLKQRLLFALSRLYHRMGQMSDTLHGAHDISSADRGLLLMIEAAGPMTVSEFARSRAVSRQFIQRLANSLIERGLLQSVGNTQDRRAPKLQLTEAGRSEAAAIREREIPYQRLLHEALSDREIEETIERLQRFDASLDAVLSQRKRPGRTE
jgi:DNA-binding MarR family transcriptional regulator